MTTPAIAFLKARGIGFSEHVYDYIEHGGAARGADELGVPAAQVVKTLVMQDEAANPLLVLTEVAQRHTGYQVGGTSPFGTRKPLPVYVERSILEMPEIYINGGRRGLLVRLAAAELSRILRAVPVSVALKD